MSLRKKKSTSLVLCKKHNDEFLIGIENVVFGCMYKNLIILRTAQFAPGTGDVFVVDAKTRNVVFEDDAGDLEVRVIDGALVYWPPSGSLEDKQCKGATVGFGCIVREKVSVNLETKKHVKIGRDKNDSWDSRPV